MRNTVQGLREALRDTDTCEPSRELQEGDRQAGDVPAKMQTWLGICQVGRGRATVPWPRGDPGPVRDADVAQVCELGGAT